MARYHFTGIKGSGMSALALIMQQWGHYVQGSDVSDTFFTQQPLEAAGISLYPFENAPLDPSMTLVAGNAFNDHHPEIERAQSLSLPILRYHQFLGEMIKPFISVAVAGTHGKTTTTGLLSHVLSYFSPINYLIGDGSGHGEKNSPYFIFEACEYKRHFLAYQPTYSIITNVELDHPDYFKDLFDVKDAFQTFSNQTSKTIIACGDDVHLRSLHFNTPVLYYGLDDSNDVYANNIQTTTEHTSFDVFYKQKQIVHLSIPMFGLHNVKNALSVVSILLLEGLDVHLFSKAFACFPGVKRRFNESHFHSNIIIDDYAHHPTEIKATMDAVKRKYPTRQIIAIFQPHTFSRTKMFLNDFAASLKEADHVFICDIFGSAREANGEVTSSDLASVIDQGETLSMNNLHLLHPYKDAVLVFMGAGDIQKYEEAYRVGF